jgi:hypothetical protein
VKIGTGLSGQVWKIVLHKKRIIPPGSFYAGLLGFGVFLGGKAAALYPGHPIAPALVQLLVYACFHKFLGN